MAPMMEAAGWCGQARGSRASRARSANRSLSVRLRAIPTDSAHRTVDFGLGDARGHGTVAALCDIMLTRAWLLTPIFAGALLSACSSDTLSDDESGPSEDALVSDVTTADVAPEVLVKDPRTLAKLEERFSAAAMLGGAGGTTLAALAQSSPVYRDLAAAVAADIADVKRTDPESGKGFAFGHRLFDDTWLTWDKARLELVGVTNRVDLMFRGGCGETHFVYRLAYTTTTGGTTVDSRLPFTMNVLVPTPDDGQRCRTVASKWLAVAQATDVGGALLAGPLAGLAKPTRVEVDYQRVRWPSAVRPEMGGHAEYTLRAFTMSEGRLAPAPLDDTPRLDLDAAGRGQLLEWVKASLDDIDRGTARVPADLLATSAVSVAPRAAARAANKPFSALLDERDLATLPLAGRATIASPKALLHKLDGITCQGCHQSRGIAGFHLLGEERRGTMRLNALFVGASPHLLDAVKWRASFVRALASGAEPPKRNAPDHASGEAVGYGGHCSLGADPGFADFQCQSRFVCKRVDDDVLGQCMPRGTPGFGDACEDSKVRASVDSHRDTATSRELECAGGATCFLRSGKGFPDGMCQKRCETVGEPLGDGTICAGVPFGSGPLGGFNKCMFELRRPFEVCLADDVRPTTSRACDEANPCRDDYACARIYAKDDRDTRVGVCEPPYFVFQGRVDGHPSPTTK